MDLLKYEPQKTLFGADQRGSYSSVFFSPSVSPGYKVVEELEDKVILNCDRGITWLRGTKGKSSSDNKILDLGKRILDPRGLYYCNVTVENSFKIFTVQVYYRSMCLLNLWVGMDGSSGIENFLAGGSCGGPVYSLNQLGSLL